MKKVFIGIFMVFAFVAIAKADDIEQGIALPIQSYDENVFTSVFYEEINCMPIVLIYMVSVIIFLLLIKKVAEKKEMGVEGAYLYVLLFGLLGFLIVLCSKDKEEKQKTVKEITPEKELVLLEKMYKKRVMSKDIYEKRKKAILKKQNINHDELTSASEINVEEKKLQTLESLRLKGLITEEEYNKKREEVISKLQ